MAAPCMNFQIFWWVREEPNLIRVSRDTSFTFFVWTIWSLRSSMYITELISFPFTTQYFGCGNGCGSQKEVYLDYLFRRYLYIIIANSKHFAESKNYATLPNFAGFFSALKSCSTVLCRSCRKEFQSGETIKVIFCTSWLTSTGNINESSRNMINGDLYLIFKKQGHSGRCGSNATLLPKPWVKKCAITIWKYATLPFIADCTCVEIFWGMIVIVDGI